MGSLKHRVQLFASPQTTYRHDETQEEDPMYHESLGGGVCCVSFEEHNLARISHGASTEPRREIVLNKTVRFRGADPPAECPSERPSGECRRCFHAQRRLETQSAHERFGSLECKPRPYRNVPLNATCHCMC